MHGPRLMISAVLPSPVGFEPSLLGCAWHRSARVPFDAVQQSMITAPAPQRVGVAVKLSAWQMRVLIMFREGGEAPARASSVASVLEGGRAPGRQAPGVRLPGSPARGDPGLTGCDPRLRVGCLAGGGPHRPNRSAAVVYEALDEWTPGVQSPSGRARSRRPTRPWRGRRSGERRTLRRREIRSGLGLPYLPPVIGALGPVPGRRTRRMSSRPCTTACLGSTLSSPSGECGPRRSGGGRLIR